MRRSTALVRLAVTLLLLAAVLQVQVPAAQSAVCTEGQLKTVFVGPICGCVDGVSTPKDRYKCIGGQWVYQYSFCSGPFCQGGEGYSCQEQPGSCRYQPGMVCPAYCSCCY